MACSPAFNLGPSVFVGEITVICLPDQTPKLLSDLGFTDSTLSTLTTIVFSAAGKDERFVSLTALTVPAKIRADDFVHSAI
jgi:hypothetical protein